MIIIIISTLAWLLIGFLISLLIHRIVKVDFKVPDLLFSCLGPLMLIALIVGLLIDLFVKLGFSTSTVLFKFNKKDKNRRV